MDEEALRREYEEYRLRAEYDQYVRSQTQQQPTPNWNPLESAKQFGAGAMRGLASTAGMAADLGLMATWKQKPQDGFVQTDRLLSALEPYLPAKNKDYRYAETVGQFVGPGAALNKLAKVPVAGGALFDALTGLGARFGGDVTGEEVLGPTVGALGTAGALQLAKEGAGAMRRAFMPKAERAKQNAAASFKELTGLTEDDIKAGIARLSPNDELSRFKTTSELTENPGVAAIQQELSGGSTIAADFGEARTAARNSMLDDMTTVPSVNRSELGEELINKARATRNAMTEGEKADWEKVPRKEAIYVGDIQNKVAGILESRQGGFAPGSRMRTLIDQVMVSAEADKALPSGALKEIRTELLDMNPENLTAIEKQLRGVLTSEITRSLDTQLKDPTAWQASRAITAEKGRLFDSAAPGGSLVNPQTQVENAAKNAWRGGAQSTKMLLDVVGNDPETVERIKRFVIDEIPRVDGGTELSTDKMYKWLRANEGGAKVLFGGDHVRRMKMILDDLRSADKVRKFANYGQKGISSTAGRLRAGEKLLGSLVGNIVPGAQPIKDLVTSIQSALGLQVKEVVEDWLLRASLDPNVALELVKTGTDDRVQTLLQQFARATSNVAAQSGRAAGLAVAGSASDRNQQGFGASQSLDRLQSRNLLPTNGYPARQAQPRSQSNIPFKKGSMDSDPNPKKSQPVTKENISALLDEQPPIVRAIAEVESAMNPSAESPVGAKGLMQIMPFHYERLGITDPFDAAQSIKGGATIFNEELERFGDPALALAAYNAGSPKVIAAIKKAGSRNIEDIKPYLPLETRKYVAKVIRALQKYQTTEV